MSNREGKDKLNIRDIRALIKAKDIAGIVKVGKNLILNSQVWRSFFRHGQEDTPKTRMQTVISNAFLHLHPAKV